MNNEKLKRQFAQIDEFCAREEERRKNLGLLQRGNSKLAKLDICLIRLLKKGTSLRQIRRYLKEYEQINVNISTISRYLRKHHGDLFKNKASQPANESSNNVGHVKE